jgi:hypothetical protein
LSLDSSSSFSRRDGHLFSFCNSRRITMTDFDNGRAAAVDAIRKAHNTPHSLGPYGAALDRTATLRKAHRPDGARVIDTATTMIKKLHARGPTSPTDDVEVSAMPLSKAERTAIRRAKKPKKTQLSQRGVDAIKDIHAKGGRPLTGDFLSKAETPSTVDDTRPLQKRQFSSAWWNAATWQERRDALLKGQQVKLPPQSSNASSETELAQTGAENDWDDEETASPAVEHVAGFDDTNVSPRDPRIAAAVSSVPSEAATQAIKQALLPKNKRVMMP